MVNVGTTVQTIRTVLDNNLTDVWEIATGRKRSTQVYKNDLRMGGDFPKIFLDFEGPEAEKLNWGGGKTVHKNRNMVSMDIVYLNKERQKLHSGGVTYEDGGSNDSQSLNRFMLEEIKRVLITNAQSLSNIHNLRFGQISGTSKEGDVYMGFIPITYQWVETVQ